MAFGQYATLVSAFPGADENPLSEGGIWTNKIITTSSNMRLVSNGAIGTGADSNAWYNVATYNADVEAYYTMAAKPSGTDWLRLFIRLQTPGTAGVDGYMVQIQMAAGTDHAEIYRIDNGSFTQIATVTQEWTAGDKFGLQAIGSAIDLYYNSGGGWSSIASATDSTYALGGYVGIGGKTTGRIDDLYAGSILPASGAGVAGLAQAVNYWWWE